MRICKAGLRNGCYRMRMHLGAYWTSQMSTSVSQTSGRVPPDVTRWQGTLFQSQGDTLECTGRYD